MITLRMWEFQEAKPCHSKASQDVSLLLNSTFNVSLNIDTFLFGRKKWNLNHISYLCACFCYASNHQNSIIGAEIHIVTSVVKWLMVSKNSFMHANHHHHDPKILFIQSRNSVTQTVFHNFLIQLNPPPTFRRILCMVSGLRERTG